MTQQEIAAILAAMIDQCAALGQPLTPQQQGIFWQVMTQLTAADQGEATLNPLAELAPAERQALIDFIATCERNEQNWKTCFLEDWLQSRDSGPVQFIRQRYGPQWLLQVQPVHLAAYLEPITVQLKLGDSLEISNSLWEWVPDGRPELREWYPCQVVRVFQSDDQERVCDHCTVRLDNGSEYDILGVHDWNRSHWRFPHGQAYSTGTD